jgi:hypothetical protein
VERGPAKHELKRGIIEPHDYGGRCMSSEPPFLRKPGVALEDGIAATS